MSADTSGPYPTDDLEAVLRLLMSPPPKVNADDIVEQITAQGCVCDEGVIEEAKKRSKVLLDALDELMAYLQGTIGWVTVTLNSHRCCKCDTSIACVTVMTPEQIQQEKEDAKRRFLSSLMGGADPFMTQ